MNRYAIQGLALDLMDGKQIALMAVTRVSGRKALRSFYDFVDGPGVIGRWTNGAERVEHPSGGEVRLLTAGFDSLRGAKPDVLVILDFRFIDQRLAEDLVVLGQDVEIIRW